MVGKKKDLVYRHTELLFQFAQAPTETIPRFLRTSRRGLTDIEAERRLKEYGTNEIAREKSDSVFSLIFKALWNPFNLLVSSLALVSYLTGDLRAAILMSAMVVLSAGITLFQGFRSGRAVDSLRAMVTSSATAIRRTVSSESDSHLPGSQREIPMSQLVPGDIIRLSAGDMIPADVRLLTAKHLFVSQAGVTGESLPVEKSAEPFKTITQDLAEIRNICFMGTNIVSGSATAAIIKTGSETFVGSLAKSVVGQSVVTSFDRGIRRFVNLMLIFMAVMVPLVFLINGFTKHNWSDAFLFAIAVAVGLTPEMLPMILTVNLAKGAMAMARKKVVVKKLNAIQNFGAMNILCTDKTGTLTQHEVIVGGSVDAMGKDDATVMHLAYLNSFFQTGLRNFMDEAVVLHVRNTAQNLTEGRTLPYTLIDEVPFDFERKCMSVLIEHKDGLRQLICKGAVEEVLQHCVAFQTLGTRIPMCTEKRNHIYETAKELNRKGLRILAVAVKEMPSTQDDCSASDETHLTLLGYISFLDPPTKDSALLAIRALSNYGIAVKILTGDNERVTARVAAEVGLPSEKFLLGHQIEGMSNDELRHAVEEITIFAKLNPAHKQRIVQVLRKAGYVVGFLGDGINDAPALRAADVGISVNNAVDVAKESADIILLEKDLLVLEEGVVEGRKVFGNIIKYIKMGASSNFGNVFSVLGASCFLPFLPMMPVQLLTQNFLYDISQAGIPFDQVDREYLEKPRRWEIGDIGRFMLFMGPISSLFDYATFSLMWFYFGANHPEIQNLFQSGWFIEGLLSQTLIVHIIRTRKIPFFQSRASIALSLTTASVMTAGIWIPFSQFGRSLGFVPLPWAYFPWLIVILMSYCVLAQLAKTWFIRKFGYN